MRHMALGKTPAEAASINLKLGRNAWLGLITLRAKIFIIVYLPSLEQDRMSAIDLPNNAKTKIKTVIPLDIKSLKHLRSFICLV